MKLLLLSSLLFTTSVFAAIGGRCSGSWNNGYCICETMATCQKYANTEIIIRGGNGEYPCPYDANNVVGCMVKACASGYTQCAFTDQCAKDHGTVLSTPSCPGGSNFVCCKEHT